MRQTLQLVRLVSVKYCKRWTLKVVDPVLIVFVVEYRVAAWLLAKEVVLSMVFLRNALPLRRWTLRLSSLFLPSFLFLRPEVVVMLTGVVFLCWVVLHRCRRSILFWWPWWPWWRRLMWQQLRLLLWIHGNMFHEVVIIVVFGLCGCPAFCLWE
jgi:hypothetical protein